MGPGIFLIAIMGCGEADAPCQTVRTLETRFESQAACTAATEAAVAGAGDVDSPVVVAQCVAAGARASVRAADVKLPAGGHADVKVSPIKI
jgi:hypothetical protein